MVCIANADPSIFGYLDALWCVVRGHIFEHYTALAVCMAIGGTIATFLLRKLFPRVQLDKKVITKAAAIWSVMTFVFGLLVSALTVAPYTLYSGFAEQAKQLTKANNDLKATDKEKILGSLREFLAAGRWIESQLKQNPVIVSELIKQRIHDDEEQLNLYLESTRYRKYKSWLTDEKLNPPIAYPQGSNNEWRKYWKLVVTYNFRLVEMIRAISAEGAIPS